MRGVSGSGCEARGASGGRGDRIADLACGCVSRPGKGAEERRPLPPVHEHPDALDGFARTGVDGGFRLEQRQHTLGAMGGPKSEKAAIFVAQRDPAEFAIVVRFHFSTVVTRARKFVSHAPEHICRICASRSTTRESR